MKKEVKEIRITSEMFQALLQGKKLEMVVGMKNPERTVIYPPHYGLHFTFEQIAEIQHAARRAGAREVMDLLDGVTSH